MHTSLQQDTLHDKGTTGFKRKTKSLIIIKKEMIKDIFIEERSVYMEAVFVSGNW